MRGETLQQAMERLARDVSSMPIVGRIPEPLIDPLLRAQGLAHWIVRQLDQRRTSRSGVPITRRKA